jgi:hypothetical protein
MEQLVHRVSTIVVGESNRTRIYHSLEELPKDLRKQMERSMSSESSATLLIADERGREEIMRKLDGRSSVLQSRLVESILRQRRALDPAPAKLKIRWMRVAAAAFVMVAALVAVGR